MSPVHRIIILIVPLLLLSSCNLHVRKFYEGNKKPSEIAIVHTIGPAAVWVRYMNHKPASYSTGAKELHLAPGKYHFILGYLLDYKSTTQGSETTWLYFETEMEFQANMTYVPYTSPAMELNKNDICFLMVKHGEEYVRSEMHNNVDFKLPTDKAKKVGCGKLINAKEYEKRFSNFGLQGK